MDELDYLYAGANPLRRYYGFEPGRRLAELVENTALVEELPECDREVVRAKIPQFCRRLVMMHLAGEKALRRESKFVARLNHDSPALAPDTETEILYHLEAMVLFSRTALDSMAYIYTLLQPSRPGAARPLRFTDLSRRLIRSRDDFLLPVREALVRSRNSDLDWFRMVWGSEVGSAMKNRLPFQRISRIDYGRNECGCVGPLHERECCHVVLKTVTDGRPLFTRMTLARFVHGLRDGVMHFADCLERAMVEGVLKRAASRNLHSPRNRTTNRK